MDTREDDGERLGAGATTAAPIGAVCRALIGVATIAASGGTSAATTGAPIGAVCRAMIGVAIGAAAEVSAGSAIGVVRLLVICDRKGE